MTIRRQLVECALRPPGSRHTLAELASATTLHHVDVRIVLVRLAERSRWDGGPTVGTDGKVWWLLGAAEKKEE